MGFSGQASLSLVPDSPRPPPKSLANCRGSRSQPTAPDVPAVTARDVAARAVARRVSQMVCVKLPARAWLLLCEYTRYKS